ncbi:Glutathione-regulated potassium-efflux system protein KefC [Phycisphaerae bacterium RAS2]|nr:Glutathione-regulated potassium-efflux system protein KefC [Phycisphaerae bacterium RAS2]
MVAAAQDLQFLQHTVLLFGAALIVAWLFRIVRAPAVIGFLFSGILIGPSGLKLISADAVHQFAELGLVMLLFTIGLELSPQPLLRSGSRLLLAAGLQMSLTALVAFVVLRLTTGLTTGPVLVLAMALALSSTAIVLKQLADQRQTDSSGGLLITGILLLQDVFVILAMIFFPLLAAQEGVSWISMASQAGLSLAALAGVTILARRILPWFLGQVALHGGRELITLFAVLMAVAGAWVAGRAGWSWGLGACIAGLLLSQTDLRHQLSAEIMPFRDTFNALFFISMGMLVDVTTVVPHLPAILLAIFATLVLKAILTAVSISLAGWPARLSVFAGLGLATISEFSYILAREAQSLNLLPSGAMNVLTAVIVGTMMVGALLLPIANVLTARVVRAARDRPAETPAAATAWDQHVLIIGYGLNGQNLSRVLKATGIPFCIVEMNPVLVRAARHDGWQIVPGDATRLVILEHAGLARARAMVVAINDVAATRRIVAQARTRRPDLFILARTRNVAEIDLLHRLGAQQVIPEEFETSIEIFTHLLHHLGVADNVIEAQVAMIRAGHYGMLRGLPDSAARRAELIQLFDATATQTYLVAAESPAVGKSIREVDLRAATGVSIIAIVRDGKPTTNPGPEWAFAGGDLLILLGGHKQLDEAKALLDPPAEQESQA